MFKDSKINLKQVSQVLVYIVIGVFVLNKSAVYFPDSYAFLRMDFNRSPVYNIFLKIIKTCFKANYERPTIILQYSFIVFSINYFLKALNKAFKINIIGLLFIQLVLLAPCVYLHFVANTILSEALSYPLVLIIVTQFLKLGFSGNLNYVYKSLPLLVILVLTRGQFVVFVPVLLLLTLFVFFKQKRSLIVIAKIIIPILLLPVLTQTIEKIYNKVTYGYYVNNSMNYVHLISSLFYLSDADDVEIFNNEDEKMYFNLVHHSLEEASLTRSQALESKEDEYILFEYNFSSICNARVHEIGLNYFKKKGLNFFEQNIALNKMCSKMVVPLFKQNFKKWVVFYYKNLKNSFGSSKQMLLYLMLLIYAFIYLFKSNMILYKFLFITTLLMFANNALIALVIHSIKRYVFYFDWVIFAIIVLLLNEILKKELNES